MKRYFTPILFSLTAVFSLLLMSGCATPSTGSENQQAWQKHGPFAVRFPKTVQWTSGQKKGYDPSLPGYHITGDIGSFRLLPAAEKPPKKFVLAITTSPGAKPHLDHFRLSVRGMNFDCEPLNSKAPTRISSNNRERNIFKYAPTSTYFDFKIKANEIRVTLKSTLIKMMQGECTISWIDWYRK